ncbi:ribokinase [Glaciecola sp. SC05]|uniref:ribokinase n=1 Tax=Glaciecola sp. SC05 TaxID=1987355 RepID=UPI003528042C
MAVFNFGSINIDHVYAVEHFVAPGETLSSSSYRAILGGKGANQSIACAKAGITTFHVGSINQNDAAMLRPMIDANVNMQFVSKQTELASGHAIIQVNAQGENAIILFPGANHSLTDKCINEVLSQANPEDWVLLQNETNHVDKVIDLAYAAKVKIAFNPAPMTNAVNDLPLDKISLLIVNEVEAMQLTGAKTVELAKQALLEISNNTDVLLTLGKQGVIYLRQQQEVRVSAFNVKAIDTTAAGDTFIGYFLAHFAKHTNIEHALRLACAASAIGVTREGAAPSIPSLDEVEQFLQNHS